MFKYSPIILLSITALIRLRTAQAEWKFLNATCKYDRDCPGFQNGTDSVRCQRAYLESNKCRCTEGWVADDFKSICVPEVRKLRDKCSHDSQCEYTLGGICHLGKCVCPFAITLPNDGHCESTLQRLYCAAPVGGDCSFVAPKECGLSRIREAAKRGLPTCYCGGKYEEQKGKGILSCVPSAKKVGETCSLNQECFEPISQPHAQCLNGRCACVAGAHEIDGKCYFDMEHGRSCFRENRRYTKCFSLLPGTSENVLACKDDVCGCAADYHYVEGLKTCRKNRGPKHTHVRITDWTPIPYIIRSMSIWGGIGNP